MPTRFAAAFTMCQIALGVIPSPHIFPSRLTRRKIAPPLMAAAVVHSSTARFAHIWNRNGTDVLSFANQVSDYPMLLANLEIFHSESHQFSPSQAASDEQCQNRPITLASETV
jgi:hypothetical protein